jgi:hypothetical protein
MVIIMTLKITMIDGKTFEITPNPTIYPNNKEGYEAFMKGLLSKKWYVGDNYSINTDQIVYIEKVKPNE